MMVINVKQDTARRVPTSILVILLLLTLSMTGTGLAQDAETMPTCTFKNPLLPGQDPSVVFKDGSYYLVQSGASGLMMRQSATLSGLGEAAPVNIFTPPGGTPYGYDVWAPELVYVQDAWYIYVAADDAPGNNDLHRTFVLKADTADPMGTWTMLGPLFRTLELDRWSIDLTVFEFNEKLYAVWSAAGGDDSFSGFTYPQVLLIAEMSDPFNVIGTPVKILVPDQPWEMSVQPIAEGAEAFIHDGNLSIVYSADASWSREYKLATLQLTGDDPLDAAAWTKVGIAFEGYENADGTEAVYGVGHNSMPVMSPDGSEWWLVYHAKALREDGWEDRDIRIQKFTWNEDGTPNFGTPIPAVTSQIVPAGEPCGEVAAFSFEGSDTAAKTSGSPISVEGAVGKGLAFDGDDFVELTPAPLMTTGSYTVAAWVNLTDTAGDYTLIAQEGGLYSAFRLHYDPTAQSFALTANQLNGELEVSAAASLTIEPGTWYHLAAVRDALNGKIQLYINGELAAEQPLVNDWRAVGALMLGAGKERAQRTTLLKGALDEVKLYNGALSASEIAALAQ